jgi:hypothetical protein
MTVGGIVARVASSGPAILGRAITSRSLQHWHHRQFVFLLVVFSSASHGCYDRQRVHPRIPVRQDTPASRWRKAGKVTNAPSQYRHLVVVRLH